MPVRAHTLSPPSARLLARPHARPQIFHGAVIDVSPRTLTIEVTGKEDKMRALQEVLEPYGEHLGLLYLELISWV